MLKYKLAEKLYTKFSLNAHFFMESQNTSSDADSKRVYVVLKLLFLN